MKAFHNAIPTREPKTVGNSKTFASYRGDAFEAIGCAAVTSVATAHFQLSVAAWGLAAACTLAISTARLARPVLRRLRPHASAHVEAASPEDALRQAESSTTAGGVALVAVIACLATDPLKAADPDMQSAIIFMVVASAFFLLFCRLAAQDALRALARHRGAEQDFPFRSPPSWALLSLASVAFAGGLLVIAVW